jgi:hypothetical protein
MSQYRPTIVLGAALVCMALVSSLASSVKCWIHGVWATDQLFTCQVGGHKPTELANFPTQFFASGHQPHLQKASRSYEFLIFLQFGFQTKLLKYYPAWAYDTKELKVKSKWVWE